VSEGGSQAFLISQIPFSGRFRGRSFIAPVPAMSTKYLPQMLTERHDASTANEKRIKDHDRQS